MIIYMGRDEVKSSYSSSSFRVVYARLGLTGARLRRGSDPVCVAIRRLVLRGQGFLRTCISACLSRYQDRYPTEDVPEALL
jgi:hypothetical protein